MKEREGTEKTDPGCQLPTPPVSPTASNPEDPLGSSSSSSVQLWDTQDFPAEGPMSP